MFDNDLLRNYKHTLTRTGILDLGNTKDFSYSHLERGVWKMYGKDKLYYTKAVNKCRMDAEVILSRAAKIAGLKTATYYAMQNPNFDDPNLTERDIIRLQNYQYVVSDNVVDENTMLASEFFKLVGGGDRANTQMPYSFFNVNNLQDYTKYFTKEAMIDLLKMSIFDPFAFNFDRHEDNFAFQIQNGIVTGVVLFDYAAGGVGAKDRFINQTYCSVLQPEELNKTLTIEAVRDNPIASEIISNHELAEEMGRINFGEISKECKEEMGYRTSPMYIDKLSRSFEECALILDK